MTKYKIVHDREICIGCAACAGVCPKYWVMNSDGKSDVVGATVENGMELLGSNENPLTEDYDSNIDAAESCPVNCIHIHEIDESGSDKKII